jgi:hypothetical protein
LDGCRTPPPRRARERRKPWLSLSKPGLSRVSRGFLEQRLGHWPPKGRWALFSTKLEHVGHVDAPVAIVSDKFCAVPITGKPNPPVDAI